MSADPRAALAVFIAALERHLEACAYKHGDDDPAVITAADALADAFDTYDETLLQAFGEVTPLEVYDGESSDEFADAEDFDDDDDDDDYEDDDDDDDDDDDVDAEGDAGDEDADDDDFDDFDDHIQGDEDLNR